MDIQKKVLLVEDELLIQIPEKSMLKSKGFDVTVANTGALAIDLAGKDVYDLIFMDLGLPDIDGIEVTKKIRKNARENLHKPSVIIALTAPPFKERGELCQATGMNAYIQKPLSINKIDRILQSGDFNTFNEIA